MKVGIVTVHDLNNFGAFLQAYGLQHTLEDMGHEVYFIRSHTKKYARGMFYRIRPYGKEYRHLPSFICKNVKGWKKHQVFLRDLSCFRVLENYGDEKLNLVILGSDEIWNTTNPLFQNDIFYGKGMHPVMAYAPSIGNASFEDMKCIPVELFKRIDPILVRDVRTQEFLRTLNIDAPLVCDPTMLADVEIFRRPYHHHLMKKAPYLLLYAYGHEIHEKMQRCILDFAHQRGLRVCAVGFYISWCDGVINCSPLDFCAVLEGAACVFTSTFHGTIFSMLNHKAFVSLPYSPKTTNVLHSVGLLDRLINEETITPSLLGDLMDAPIDYNAVDAIIEAQRKKSVDLLKAGIERVANQ